MKNEDKLQNIVLTISFSFYIIMLLWGLLFRYLTPAELFRTDRFITRILYYIPYESIYEGTAGSIDIFGNVLIFIPMGIYFSLFFSGNRTYMNLLSILSTSILFEVLQYIFGIGAADITDVFHNIIGGIIGVSLYKLLKKYLINYYKLKSFVSVAGTCMVVAVSIFVAVFFTTGT